MTLVALPSLESTLLTAPRVVIDTDRRAVSIPINDEAMDVQRCFPRSNSVSEKLHVWSLSRLASNSSAPFVRMTNGKRTSGGLIHQKMYMMLFSPASAAVVSSSSDIAKSCAARVMIWTMNHVSCKSANPLESASPLLLSSISSSVMAGKAMRFSERSCLKASNVRTPSQISSPKSIREASSSASSSGLYIPATPSTCTLIPSQILCAFSGRNISETDMRSTLRFRTVAK